MQFDHRQRKVKAEALGFSTTRKFRSKLGLYCGEVVEINHPLLPMGIKTPSSMCLDSSLRYTDPALSPAVVVHYPQERCQARNDRESLGDRRSGQPQKRATARRAGF
jgi:hypothetical protein